MNKKNIFVATVVVLLLIVVGIGASGLFTLNNSSTNNSIPINIGVIEDLTGGLSTYGNWGLNGATIAVNDLKQEGYNVKLITEDSQTKPAMGVNSITKLIQENNVDFIVTGSGSSSVMSMAPIANKNKKILFTTLSSSPSISSAGDFVFRNRVSGTYEVKTLAGLIYNKFNYKNIALVVMNNEAGPAYISKFKEFYKGNIVKSLLVNSGLTDYRTEVLKIKSYNPDAVVLITPAKDGAYFIKQSSELNLNTHFFAISSIESKDLITIAGDSANGLIYVAESIFKNTDEYKKFDKAYKSKYNDDPSIYAINSYDAVVALTQSFKKCGSDKLRSCLLNTTFHGVEGDFSFDENGEVVKNLQIKEVLNNEFVNYLN